jgi:hypothetical protein
MRRIALLAMMFVLAMSGWARADVITYYVGVDGRSTPFNDLDGNAYPDNPNFEHLSLLFHHGDHFHGLGLHSYSGPAATPVLNDTNANNRTPETFTGLPPVRLLSGSGDFAGTYLSGLLSSLPQNLEYGDYELRNVHSLAGEDDTTYHSADGRWDDAFAAAVISLELISATPGLNISFSGMPTLDLTPGNRYPLGAGDELFSLSPIFWVSGLAPFGTYSAEFRLIDESGQFGDSGRYFIDVMTVPEPSTLGLTLLGAMAVARARRRHRRS